MKKTDARKRKKWIKFRHRVVRNIAYMILRPYVRLKYGIKIERFREQERRPYLILTNHQTPFDQFFLGMAVKGPVYYLATEDIFSNGFVSTLIRYLVAPIPIKKQTMDVKAVMTCLRVAREGGTIAIAPEGNRTYSGRTEYMSPAIAQLARKMNMPILLFRIEGGYGAQPRWSDVVRKGKMRAYVSRVVSPEEYATLSDEELFEIIKSTLYVNEACADGTFRHKRCAEYLERLVYVCPFCGLSEFESSGDVVKCKSCLREVRYLPTKELSGVGFDFPYRFVADWYDAQESFVNSLDPLKYEEKPLFTDKADVSEVIPYRKKQSVFQAADISLFGNRVHVACAEGELNFNFGECSALTVLGRNKLNIYFGDHVYQLKGSKRFNAIKYVHIYHRYKNVLKGEENAKFLGL